MNPVYWLLIWMAATVLACTVIAIVFFRLGWDHCEAEADRLRRHTHREGDPAPGVLLELPTAGYLSPFPEPERLTPDVGTEDRPGYWVFDGGWDQGPVAGSVEYELLTQAVMCPDCHHNNSDCRCGPDPDELLTQTAVQPVSVTGEPPIDTGELLAITDRVEAWIAGWAAQGNYDRHTIQAGE